MDKSKLIKNCQESHGAMLIKAHKTIEIKRIGNRFQLAQGVIGNHPITLQTSHFSDSKGIFDHFVTRKIDKEKFEKWSESKNSLKNGAKSTILDIPPNSLLILCSFLDVNAAFTFSHLRAEWDFLLETDHRMGLGALPQFRQVILNVVEDWSFIKELLTSPLALNIASLRLRDVPQRAVESLLVLISESCFNVKFIGMDVELAEEETESVKEILRTINENKREFGTERGDCVLEFKGDRISAISEQ